MHNIQMIGVQNLDRFSLRGCFLVIGAFGIVTLISYFNELAKAGLLSGHPRYQVMMDHTTRRSLEEHSPQDQVILHRDGDLHHLDLNLLPLQREVRNDTAGGPGDKGSDDSDEEEEEIQISLHLSKDDKYIQKNTSSTKIYQYHNTLPNFYLSMNQSLQEALDHTENFTMTGRSIVHNFTFGELHNKIQNYRNRTKVLLYQHEPGGYAVRDCYLARAIERKLVFAQAPLNAIYRKNWEMMSREQKEKFEILYGGLSFGTCESMSKECSYVAMIRHPLDRLLQAYSICSGNSNRTMCRFLKVENMTSIHQFLEHHGSSFFQKLLYYSRHCRLVGQDEVCIHDNKVYFVLTHEEKEENLKEILSSVEKWFSVVGLMEELTLSLSLMQTVTGLNFTHCSSEDHKVPQGFYRVFPTFHRFDYINQDNLKSLMIDGLPYHQMRASLLKDSKVLSWLMADMAIYDKFVDVFKRQHQVYNDLKRLMVQNLPQNNVEVKSLINTAGGNATNTRQISNNGQDALGSVTGLDTDAANNNTHPSQGETQNKDNQGHLKQNGSSTTPIINYKSTYNQVSWADLNLTISSTTAIIPIIDPVETVPDNSKNGTDIDSKQSKRKVDKINRPLLQEYNIFKRRKKKKGHQTSDATGYLYEQESQNLNSFSKTQIHEVH